MDHRKAPRAAVRVLPGLRFPDLINDQLPPTKRWSWCPNHYGIAPEEIPNDKSQIPNKVQ
jgi:hypothetical protein